MLLVWCFLALLITMIFGESQNSARITSYINERTEEGYHFQYSTNDGQQRDEAGRLKNQGDNVVLLVQGSYSYTGSDNKLRTVTYQADERGYHAHVKIIPPPSTSDSSALNIANKIFTPPPISTSDIPVLRISGGAQATLIGGGLGK